MLENVTSIIYVMFVLVHALDRALDHADHAEGSMMCTPVARVTQQT